MPSLTSCLLISALCAAILGCSSSKPPVLQSFTPIPIDIALIDKADFTEVEKIANDHHAGGNPTYGSASLTKNEPTYLYIRVFSRIDESCLRVTIDKRRSAIVNMQPDCSQETEAQ